MRFIVYYIPTEPGLPLNPLWPIYIWKQVKYNINYIDKNFEEKPYKYRIPLYSNFK
jgi:hypothetical protein